jgi:hypothetical protein
MVWKKCSLRFLKLTCFLPLEKQTLPKIVLHKTKNKNLNCHLTLIDLHLLPLLNLSQNAATNSLLCLSHLNNNIFYLLYFNRQSIDILSRVQSPSLSFLGTLTPSGLSNSFLNSSFQGKTPEINSNLVKPLLCPTTSDEQKQQQQQQQHEDIRKSSQYLLPSRKPSLQQIPQDQKPLVIGHEVSPYQECSYTQGAMNGKHLVQDYEF